LKHHRFTGLHAGESVVLEGKQNLRPGSAVVERAKDPKDAAQGAASAAAPANPVAGANPGAAAAPGAAGSADAGARPKAAP
ncbi:MAG: efflux transporter periplasmic adaptor subunit, partial [Betaproteobacteria bacterium]|nr:efflux transporter periplasmic adaptor subunit [Betaproteobacteria bacterium]